MGKIELLHGSDHVIEKPDFHLGKTNIDYGRGFYCARETYRNEIRKSRSYKDDIFVLDILREEMKRSVL